MSKIFERTLIYGVAIFFFISVIWVISGNLDNIYKPNPMHDEVLYKEISNNFTINHIRDRYVHGLEMKPITFLLVQKIFNANIVYTRLFNLILIIINTILIYKITKNKLYFLYPIFPVFLNSMWLTAETIEIMFLLLGLIYIERKGIFFGFAMIFRPYSILYSILLEKKQLKYIILIGSVFASILLYLNLFFPYLFELFGYTQGHYDEIDYLAIIMLIMLFIMSYKNKMMLKYSILALIPLYVKLYGHYFLPVYTFLFIGFLIYMKEDLKKYNF